MELSGGGWRSEAGAVPVSCHVSSVCLFGRGSSGDCGYRNLAFLAGQRGGGRTSLPRDSQDSISQRLGISSVLSYRADELRRTGPFLCSGDTQPPTQTHTHTHTYVYWRSSRSSIQSLRCREQAELGFCGREVTCQPGGTISRGPVCEGVDEARWQS